MFRDKENATDSREWLVDVPQGLWMYLEDMGYFKDDVVIEQVIAYCKSGIKRIDTSLADTENKKNDERLAIAKKDHMKELMDFYEGCKKFLAKYDKDTEEGAE